MASDSIENEGIYTKREGRRGASEKFKMSKEEVEPRTKAYSV
jgi:hypothetical protein